MCTVIFVLRFGLDTETTGISLFPQSKSRPEWALYFKCLKFRLGIKIKVKPFCYLQLHIPKNEKIRLNYYYDTSGRLVFIRFSKNMKTPKRHFEIKWPLLSKHFCEFWETYTFNAWTEIQILNGL